MVSKPATLILYQNPDTYLSEKDLNLLKNIATSYIFSLRGYFIIVTEVDGLNNLCKMAVSGCRNNHTLLGHSARSAMTNRLYNATDCIM